MAYSSTSTVPEATSQLPLMVMSPESACSFSFSMASLVAGSVTSLRSALKPDASSSKPIELLSSLTDIVALVSSSEKAGLPSTETEIGPLWASS
ncbi:hypothetical protein AGRO_2537 [Agrobacterium sp. ATCC 31749]|nr:hypothetical protein AGRO_2537 [Agrobacterium sp. ATCC 31749]